MTCVFVSHDRVHRPPRASTYPADAELPHKFRVRLDRDDLTRVTHVVVDPRRAVDPVRGFVRSLDLADQLQPPHLAHPPGQRPAAVRPRVVSRTATPGAARPSWRCVEGGLLRVDQLERPLVFEFSVAKKAAAFFRNSRSIRSSVTSRRNRSSSARSSISSVVGRVIHPRPLDRDPPTQQLFPDADVAGDLRDAASVVDDQMRGILTLLRGVSLPLGTHEGILSCQARARLFQYVHPNVFNLSIPIWVIGRSLDWDGALT